MRLKDPLLKEKILKEARKLDPRELNMRALAIASGIALGSLYTYFPSKEAILLELTAEFWQGVFATLPKESEDYHLSLSLLYGKLYEAYAVKGSLLMSCLKGNRSGMGALQKEAEEKIRKLLPEEKQYLSVFIADNLFLALQKKQEDINLLLSLI